jgi:Predicted transmembrane transcriptional regulator (anti-sigma factor)
LPKNIGKLTEKPSKNKALFLVPKRRETAGVGQSFDLGSAMKCENLQFDLSLYFDDQLDENERAIVDKHVAQCPVCRQHLAEFRALRNDFSLLTRPAVPADLLMSVRNAVAIEIQAAQIEKPAPAYSRNFREWLKFRFMPYAVGTVASLILTFSLLFSLLSARNAAIENTQLSASRSQSSEFLMASNQNEMIDDLMITPSEYAAARIPVASESPSVNPTGALVALTKSLVRGRMSDDEVVVVADVFGNGVARISEVVEPPRNQNDLKALEKALQQDPNDAAFLPADYDNRSNLVRVVLKIQRVEVVEE